MAERNLPHVDRILFTSAVYKEIKKKALMKKIIHAGYLSALIVDGTIIQYCVKRDTKVDVMLSTNTY